MTVYGRGPAECAVALIEALNRELERRGQISQQIVGARRLAAIWDQRRTRENRAALASQVERLERAVQAHKHEVDTLAHEIAKFASRVDNYVIPDVPDVAPAELWDGLELRLNRE